MKTIKFLQESFETKERSQQEISFKYSYNRDTVESVDFRINQRNIKDFYEAMQNFENSLVDEFKEKKNNFCSANQFLESISDFDKIIFVIITYMKSYFDVCKDYSRISLYVHLIQFDFTTSVLIQGFYNYSHKDLSFSAKLDFHVSSSEIELLQEKLNLIREEIYKIMGINPDLQKQGHEDNYVFNLNIESDNQIGFFLQETEV
ncbi:hypothetical protein [Klebsiella pneumoniae]|uniref:hypothetical protein n=1 Tax=Klebsiella pneumoniae TaxID=573 RepID=UPI00131B43C4|nr:hypothetical protein [Klebsiella pneumoniae]